MIATDAGDMQIIATDVAAAGAEEGVGCFTAGSAASFGYSTRVITLPVLPRYYN